MKKSLILLIVFAAFAFVACGSDKKESVSEDETKPENSNTENTEEQETTDEDTQNAETSDIEKTDADFFNRLGRISYKFSHRNLQRISLVGVKIKELDTAIAKIAHKPDSEFALLRRAHFECHVPGLDGDGQLVKRQKPRPIPRLVLHARPADIRRSQRL